MIGLSLGTRFVLRIWPAIGLAIVASFAVLTSKAASLTPLTSFGSNGYLAAFDKTYLDTSNNQRGLAYNPATNHLLVVSHPGATVSINILDATTGADVGTLNQGSGIIAGGTFLGNMIGVAGDGSIYMANLAVDTSMGGIYKIYRWQDENAAAPTVAYTNNGAGGPLNGVRIGDSFDVIGSGAGTKIVAGFGNNNVAGSNGYAVFGTTDGQSYTPTNVGFTGTPPNSGDFRLGITFTDSTHVIGTQGSSLYSYTSFSGASGNLISTPTIPDPPGATADRLLDFGAVGPKNMLAVQSIGDSHISVYDVSDPSAPVNMANGTSVPIPGSTAANGNGTGSIVWGPLSVSNPDGTFSRILYGMSTNQGIQALTFNFGPLAPVNTGDYNGDGFVNAADYVAWRTTFGLPVPNGTGADGDGNGTVGQEDYDWWRARFGNTAGGGTSLAVAVPEPGNILLALLGLAGGMLQRRVRSEHSSGN